MAGRINLTRFFAAFIIFILIGTGIGTYLITGYAKHYDDNCTALGGIPVHGAGIDLCLKPEVLLGEDNG